MLKWTTRATRIVTLVLLQCSLPQVKVNPDRKDVKRFNLSYLFDSNWKWIAMLIKFSYTYSYKWFEVSMFLLYDIGWSNKWTDRQDNKRGSKLSLWFFRWYKMVDKNLLQTVSEIVKTSLLCARWLIMLCAVSKSF